MKNGPNVVYVVKQRCEVVCVQICSLLRGGIAERGGVRVGHRIIDINGQSVVAVPHEKIVSMLATAVGEVEPRVYYFSSVLVCSEIEPLEISHSGFFGPDDLSVTETTELSMYH